ncbi:MAG: VTT domain-containing protein [Spirochaetales bacterium]|nr:VTT domain-containing protein [Spirochaetales bacterium]
MKKSKLTLIILFLICIAAIGLSLIFVKIDGIPIRSYFTPAHLVNTRDWLVKNFGLWLPLIIIALYIIFNIAGQATMFFSILCGYLYTFPSALALAWIGMSIGIASSFICGRYLFRDSFENKFGNSEHVKMLNEYIGSHPFLTSAVTRLFFVIPYNIQNYAYSCTIIKPFSYFAGTILGILPITILNVACGYLIRTGGLKDSAEVKTITSILAVIMVITIIIFIGKKKSKKCIIKAKQPMINDNQIAGKHNGTK